MSILAGSVNAPVQELGHYLQAMTGAAIPIEPARPGATGIYVGLATDFPWLKNADAAQLGPEGLLLRSDGQNLLLIGKEPAGVRHAVVAFLHTLGCRWFFPGSVWEVIPHQKTLAGSWDEQQAPSFPLQRKIFYGFGASPVCARDFAEWERHNHMGGPIRVAIGHTWHGLDPQADFAAHPEWFALVGGKRQASKPCYSHPDVVLRGREHALKQAAGGAAMITMTPPDGLGYCECERCRAVCRGGQSYLDRGAWFARRPDGVLINVTSETLYQFVNQVAAAVAEKYPAALIGCYAYSAYSHPPSFRLHPNVFLQTTTAFRRTPLSLAEQLETFQKIGVRAGIRGYFSVYQWDWDYPAVSKGDLALPQLVKDLRFYHAHGVQSVNAEASCNWAPRGLGYYLAARLLWNVQADPRALIADFYEKAFGPAARPMERYYVRWLGPYAAVHDAPAQAPAAAIATEKPRDELGQTASAGTPEFNTELLTAAFRDLDEAARLVSDQPEYRARVDHLRLYTHYLYLRLRLTQAAQAKNRQHVREAVENETIFAARLTNTSMVHSRPLLGKEFYRRFLPYKEYLEGSTEWPSSQRSAVQQAEAKGFRKVRADVPDRQELDKLWDEDRRELGMR
jgi:hypothetical protein